MTKTLEFIFDVASPNAYLAWMALPPILERTGATLKVTPCLLGGLFKATGNRSPMEAYAGVRGKSAYERLEMDRFIQRHGLSRFRMNPHFPVNTLGVARVLAGAELDGGLAPLIAPLLAAMWEDGENLADPAVLTAVLDRAGADGAALTARGQTPEAKARLLKNTEGAVARGAFGVPTFFVDGEMWFGKERLGQIEEHLSA